MKILRRIFHGLNRLLAWLFIAAVRLYQLALSPWIGRHCRFEPSCSKYFIAAIEKYGPIHGTLRGIWRICRCNPWNRGGFDPP